MKDDISHEEYRSKLANVADLAVSYINTGNGKEKIICAVLALGKCPLL